jgi:hypothetical protein
MNLQTLVKGLSGIIPGKISIKDFCMATQIGDNMAKEILDNFMQNGIGTYKNGLVLFKETDRLKTGILAISIGAAIDEVSRSLDWQDFESLAAEILEKRDFETTENFILTKPRLQIDVVGIKSDIAILIDCKHWQNMSQSALNYAVKKQIERTKRFVFEEKVKAAIPAIVTLYPNEIRFIDKVPIIPIYQLDSFCDEFYGNLEELYS